MNGRIIYFFSNEEIDNFVEKYIAVRNASKIYNNDPILRGMNFNPFLKEKFDYVSGV